MNKQQDAAEDFLKSLRWRADTVITNHFGETVWLKQVPGGITDCCDVEMPCERHAAMTR